MKTRAISRSEIEAARTEMGGWTKTQLAEWGVTWPPVKGWKARILKDGVPISPPA